MPILQEGRKNNPTVREKGTSIVEMCGDGGRMVEQNIGDPKGPLVSPLSRGDDHYSWGVAPYPQKGRGSVGLGFREAR